MPFVNRHTKKQLEKNPNLRFKDYENTLLACKRFQRSPSTIFSYAEGTRNNSTKHKDQNSPYKNLLIPRVGGIATALSAMPNIDVLVDYSVVYKTNKRGAWAFLKGDMRDVKVSVKKYNIPENLKNKNYSTDEEYRKNFKIWIEEIWEEKDKEIERLKF
jgi:1-acyl-sn-glycerol-3-phosphate acyltransferase